MSERRLDLRWTGAADEPSGYPSWRLAEIALAGRSNSGKSALVNALGGSRSLARVGRTPGRTQLLHFFADERAGVALVDLPGYGFAKVAKRERARWGPMVERYLTDRENLRGILLLLDVRRDPSDDEQSVAALAGSAGVELRLVATKIDRLGRSERVRRLRALEATRLGAWIPFSARSGEGGDLVLEAIRSLAGQGTPR